MTRPTHDRRSRTRVSANVPVKVRHADGTEQSATTRDLSSNGIFLYSDARLEPGTKLELVVMLPKELGIGAGGWALCQASVVRTEPVPGKRLGVAAALDRIELLPELH
jgi:hypothetical protein